MNAAPAEPEAPAIAALPEPVRVKADCYSAGERSVMNAWQEWKQRLLTPLLDVLDRMGFRAGHITVLSLALGLAFGPGYLLFESTSGQLLAWVLLALHLLIDGVDGPLARWQGRASQAGSYADSLADQAVIAVSTIAFMQAESLGRAGLAIFTGGSYLFLYTVVVATAMVRNALGVPYRFLLRPRMFVYTALFLEWSVPSSWAIGHAVEALVWLFNALLAFWLLSGFRALRRALRREA